MPECDDLASIVLFLSANRSKFLKFAENGVACLHL